MRQAALPFEVLAAALSHLAADIGQGFSIKDLSGERKNLVVLNGDVALINGLQLMQVSK